MEDGKTTPPKGTPPEEGNWVVGLRFGDFRVFDFEMPIKGFHKEAS